MKTRKIPGLLFVMILVFLSGISAVLFAQDYSTLYDASIDEVETQAGGRSVTSFGTIKALFIFIDFSDDTYDTGNPTWPVGAGPNYLDDIVDPLETPSSGKYSNVSTYFNDQSYSQFKMIGNAYYVQAPHPLSWYVTNHKGSEAGYATRDALEILDRTVDFSDYDRWTDTSFNHVLGADNKIDMVFACYRIWYLNKGIYGSSFVSIGWASLSLPGGSMNVDGGARSITGGHGVSVANMIEYPDWGGSVSIVVHEFGHLWDLDHQYGSGMWSIMGHRYPNTCSFMNAVEREQLGWISFHDITSSQTATLRDFGKYGDAYRIQSGSGEYFILENHQRTSIYDVPDANVPDAKGLYIIRQSPFQDYPYEGSVKVECSDGRFDWSNPLWVPFPGAVDKNGNPIVVPVFQKGSSNPTLGFNDRDMLPAKKPGSASVYYHNPIAKIDEITGKIVFGSFYKGDGKDQFNYGLSTVFTPWSNPSTCLESGTISNVGIEVLPPSSASTVDVQFFIGNPQNASPSRPQDLRTSFTDPLTVTVSWALNQEPRMLASGTYDLYRSIYYDGALLSYIKVNSAPILTATFTDRPTVPGDVPAGKDIYWRYNVKAIDNKGKVSTASDDSWLLVGKPFAPLGLAVTQATQTQITLSWAAVTGVTGYTLYQDGVPVSIPGSSTSRTVAVACGSAHAYYVTAVNGFGASDPSNTVTGTATPCTPQAPKNLVVAGITQTSITLSWDPVPGAASYIVYQNGSAIPVGISATSYAVAVACGTTHSYYVKAANAGGSSDPSNTVNGTSLPCSPVPPAGLTVTGVTQTKIDLSWSAVTGATYYVVHQDGSAIPVSIYGTTFSVGVACGSTHSYYVIAGNNGGWSGPSNTVSGTAIPCNPTGLTVTGATQTQINLSWSATSGATAYIVYQDGSAIPVSISGTTFSAGVACGTTHSYYVTAGNRGGWSGPSNTVSGTAVPCTPTGFKAAPVSSSQVDLSWNPSPGATSYTLKGYYGSIIYTGPNTSYSNTGLSCNMSIAYSLSASNASGTSGQANANATTPCAPAAPTGLAARPSSCGTGTINVSWNAVAGAAGYTLKDYNGSTTTVIYNGPATSFAHTGLAAGSPHGYSVTAWNAGGTSRYTEIPAYIYAPAACPVSYTITASVTEWAGGYFSISPAATVVNSGGSATFTVTSQIDGNAYIDVYVDDVWVKSDMINASTNPTSAYTITNVRANHTIFVDIY